MFWGFLRMFPTFIPNSLWVLGGKESSSRNERRSSSQHHDPWLADLGRQQSFLAQHARRTPAMAEGCVVLTAEGTNRGAPPEPEELWNSNYGIHGTTSTIAVGIPVESRWSNYSAAVFITNGVHQAVEPDGAGVPVGDAPEAPSSVSISPSGDDHGRSKMLTSI